MTLNSITPNAHYDMAHGKPQAIEVDNDGSFLYRLNIEPEFGVDEETGEQVQIGWMCYETRHWGNPNKATIERGVIRSLVDDCAEFDLVNSYNKHVLGIVKDEKVVQDYKDYLQFTADLEVQIAKDLSNI